jgi:F-type H+-transporting ATPase subunit delta
MTNNDSSAKQTDRDVIDVNARQVASMYAQAVLNAAQQAGQAREFVEELDSLVENVLNPYPQFEILLASALISYEDKLGILDRTFGGRASQLMMNFLKVLADHDRLSSLREIRKAAHRTYDEMQGLVRVHVTTATPLDDRLTGQITEQLRGMLGGEPKLERVVDPQLLGGIVLRVGDTIFDGSVATHLERIREQMINRSVHEIQSRRDSFSYPAGN